MERLCPSGVRRWRVAVPAASTEQTGQHLINAPLMLHCTHSFIANWTVEHQVFAYGGSGRRVPALSDAELQSERERVAGNVLAAFAAGHATD